MWGFFLHHKIFYLYLLIKQKLMGTNYYRIPTEDEIKVKHNQLQIDILNMDLSVLSIESGFRVAVDDMWNGENPWETFMDKINIHLGKRSGGWKFCWNFHDNKYYSNKEELLSFIRSGRVINEYSEELTPEEFITMALEWGEPDGAIYDKEYRMKQWEKGYGTFLHTDSYDDRIIDGLRVSSSNDFC
jgi:hypothetical protein